MKTAYSTRIHLSLPLAIGCLASEDAIFSVICFFFVFFYISLTVGASRLIEVYLPRLLFGVGFQIFIVTPQMFRFSRDYIENV